MDGKNWVMLPTVRDYKRIGDGDRGENTDGMGGYAPVLWLTPETEAKIVSQIVQPTMCGLQEDKLTYRGFLYFGIMVDTAGDPWVLEYNVRIGNPEVHNIFMGDPCAWQPLPRMRRRVGSV